MTTPSQRISDITERLIQRARQLYDVQTFFTLRPHIHLACQVQALIAFEDEKAGFLPGPEGDPMPKRQSSPETSTLAAKLMNETKGTVGRYLWVSKRNIRKLCASVLAQDETKGQVRTVRVDARAVRAAVDRGLKRLSAKKRKAKAAR